MICQMRMEGQMPPEVDTIGYQHVMRLNSDNNTGVLVHHCHVRSRQTRYCIQKRKVHDHGGIPFEQRIYNTL